MDEKTALAKANSQFQLTLGKEELTLIKDTVTPGASQTEFNLFVYDCQSRGLNPLKKEMYWVKRGAKASHQVGIDGFRIMAQKTGEYGGQTKVEYGDPVTLYGKEYPEYADIGVYRKGCEHPIYARAYFEEYAQAFNGKLGNMWLKMPRLMIAKCAEALALRKAFPDSLAGLYTNDEMEQAEVSVVEEAPKAPKAPAKAVKKPAKAKVEKAADDIDLNVSAEFKEIFLEYCDACKIADEDQRKAGLKKLVGDKKITEIPAKELQKHIEKMKKYISKQNAIEQTKDAEDIFDAKAE